MCTPNPLHGRVRSAGFRGAGTPSRQTVVSSGRVLAAVLARPFRAIGPVPLSLSHPGGMLLRCETGDPPHRVQQHVLPEQVVDGVAGQRQLREHRHCHAQLGAATADVHDALGVADRVGDEDIRRARRDPGEAV